MPILWIAKCFTFYVCGDLPKAEPVVWSLCGIKWPMPPESQSHSTPDSAGGLFTQPQKSISKSQKPERNNTDTHYARIHTCAHLEQLLNQMHLHSFSSFIHFFCFYSKMWGLQQSLTWRGTGTIQDSEVIYGDISPRSIPNHRLKNHLMTKFIL